MAKKNIGKAVLFCSLLLSILSPLSAHARTTATNAETTIGTACTRMVHGTDFDTLFQCNNSAGGTIQTAPIVVGTVTSPPYSNLLCDSSKAGMIQWTGSQLQACDGNNWGVISPSSCTAPNDFNFTDQTNVALNTAITSNAVTLSGNSFTCSASATCSGCTTILKNGVSQGTSATFSAGDTAAIRLTSSSASSGGVTTTATLTVGDTTSSTWSVTTMDIPCPGSPAVGTICSDGSIYAGLSPDGNKKMFATPCDQGSPWGGGKSCNNNTWKVYSWGTYGIRTSTESTTDGDGNTARLLASYSTYTDDQGIYGVPAAQICANLTAHGKSDWYLPASEELNILYTNRSAIGNFKTIGVSYWSSTQAYGSSDASLDYRFSDGALGASGRQGTYLVRCVRK